MAGPLSSSSPPSPVGLTYICRFQLTPVYYPDYYPTQWQTVLASWALYVSRRVTAVFAETSILILGVIGILSQHWLHYVDMFSIVWIVAVYVASPWSISDLTRSVLATVITLPIKAAAGRRSAHYVFT